MNLEDPEVRRLAELDPKGLLSQFPEGCFIDEIQRCPELLSYIQVIVDKDQTPGKFILSGSHQLSLQDAVGQSLAGRTAIIKLLPLSQEELIAYDSGLLCYLLGIRSAEQLQNHPSRGAIFETYVVSEAMKYLWNRVRESNLYFFKDSQLELDLLVDTTSGLMPVEIKSSSTFREDLLNQLIKADSRILGLQKKALVYAGESSQQVSNIKVIPFSQLSTLGREISS